MRLSELLFRNGEHQSPMVHLYESRDRSALKSLPHITRCDFSHRLSNGGFDLNGIVDGVDCGVGIVRGGRWVTGGCTGAGGGGITGRGSNGDAGATAPSLE